MASEQARELRQRGIEAAKAGQKDEARQLLQQSIRLEPNNEAAWLWLASVARDNRERLFCLQKLLEINPDNQQGLKAMQMLQGTAAPPSAEPPRQTSEVPVIRPIGGIKPLAQSAPQLSTQEIMAQAPGVPVPSAEQLAEAQKQADSLVRMYLAPAPPVEGIKWTHKTRGRAGERDAMVMRIYLASGTLVAIAVVVAVLGVIAFNIPEVRAVVFAPTATYTFTPTFTPTPTPGITPTPSATPPLTLTPSPTVVESIPKYDPYFPPRPTDNYPAANTVLRGAIALVDQGRVSVALPTLAAERGLTTNVFNPNPYYYEALALADAGDFDRAQRTLEDAESRLSEVSQGDQLKFQPVIDAGFAYVYIQLAKDLFERRRPGEARDYLSLVRQRADAAIKGDPRNPVPYQALAETYALNGDYGQTIRILDSALALPELQSNVNLIVQKGEAFFEQGEYDLAQYQAFLALYIDAQTEPAHLLQIRIAEAQKDAGLMVIYTQQYLYYFPGSVLGWKLLGEARLMENKPDLALQAFNQALMSKEESPESVEVLRARARIYMQQRRYDLARDDLTRAFDLTGDPEIQAERMQAAYAAGNTSTAIADADELLGKGILPDDEINLVKARALIDSARETDNTVYQEALGLLNAADNLPDDLLPVANEYLARTQFALRNYANALKAIDSALNAGQTVNRRYWRGRILEAQGQHDDALREYDWALTWGEIYPFDFRADARDRFEQLRS